MNTQNSGNTKNFTSDISITAKLTQLSKVLMWWCTLHSHPMWTPRTAQLKPTHVMKKRLKTTYYRAIYWPTNIKQLFLPVNMKSKHYFVQTWQNHKIYYILFHSPIAYQQYPITVLDVCQTQLCIYHLKSAIFRNTFLCAAVD